MPIFRKAFTYVLFAIFVAACGGNAVSSVQPAQQRDRKGTVEIGKIEFVRNDDCRVPSSRRALEVLHERGGLIRENMVADVLGYEHAEDEGHLQRLIATGTLVPIAPTEAHGFAETFGEHAGDKRNLYTCAMPQVKRFLDKELSEWYRCFGEKFNLASIVRTDEYQKKLRRNNKFAAKGTNDKNKTVHTTGAVVDIGVTLLPVNVRNWLRHRLAKLEREGKVQATEEVHRYRGGVSYCLHVMVYPEEFRTTSTYLSAEL